MAVTPAPVTQGQGPPGPSPAARAHAPIRWPRPQAVGVAWVSVWAVGLVFGVLAPAMVVSPFATSAPHGRVWVAFGLTVLGIAISVGGFAGLQHRYHQGGLAALAVAPASALLIGGFALLGELLSS